MRTLPRNSKRNQQMPRAGSSEPAQDFNQLLADIQLANQIQIPLWVMLANVIQERSSLTDHPKQTASARIIADSTTHVLRHSIDSFRQHGNLHIGRSIVTLMCAELSDNFVFSFFCNGHVKRNSHLLKNDDLRISGRPRFFGWDDECYRLFQVLQRQFIPRLG